MYLDYSRLPVIVYNIRVSGFPHMIPNCSEQELLPWKKSIGRNRKWNDQKYENLGSLKKMRKIECCNMSISLCYDLNAA